MLVLALQFSKGTAQDLPAGRTLSRTTTEQLIPSGAEAAAEERRPKWTMVMPCGEEATLTGPAPSKRKRRQSSSKWTCQEGEPRADTHISKNPPMHQLGNDCNRTDRTPVID
jgi:hypothetical protein